MTKGSHQGVIYCNGAGGGSNGWAFPLPVERRIQRQLAGLSVLHFFGGTARFGIRMDIDQLTRPDVIADAWAPPFGKDSFDAVVLDPPYVKYGRHMRDQLGRSAAWIARQQVCWFSPFAATSLPRCSILKWWTVIVGNNCYIRQLVFFRPRPDKEAPYETVNRGPAIRYNGWRMGQDRLPLRTGETGPENFA